MPPATNADPAAIPPATGFRLRVLLAVAGAILTSLAGWLGLSRPGEGLAMLSYDMPFLVHRAGGAENLRLVYLDNFHDKRFGREIQAPLLDRLRESGAAAVLYDVIFNEPWAADPSVDEAFAAAIRRFRGVDEDGRPLPGRMPSPLLLATEREQTSQTGAYVENLLAPIEILMDAASEGDDDEGIAVVTVTPDPNFVVRELITGTSDYPSLTWRAAVALGAPLQESTRQETRWINFVGPPPRPDDPDARLAIHSLSAKDVLSGETSLLRGKIVIVGGKPGIAGFSAGQDVFSTPFHRFSRRERLPLMSGVELQANMLANLLNGNWLTRSGRSFDLGLILATGLLAGAGLTLTRPGRGVFLAPMLMLLLMGVGTLTVMHGRFWFPWSIAAFLQVPVALVGGVGSHFYVERFLRLRLSTEQRQLRAAFARYLSPQMLQELTRENFRLEIGGQKIQAAMMFTDIEAFTDMCQQVRDPQRIVAMLNDYFERTTGHIFDHDGVVIKFIGDAIFAAWGAPLADPAAPQKAARAAWRLSQSDRLSVDGVELKTRIGLHFGDVVAGNVGTEKHVDYTLIGDAVNLASRLEGLNRMLGTRILLSDAVKAHLGEEFRLRRVGLFQVKGRQEPTEVWEHLGPAQQPDEPAWITLYHDAVTALQAGDRDAARALFGRASEVRGAQGDGPSRFFLGLLEANAPLEKGGVVAMTEK